ncbi:MAG: hypothetical protein WCI06_04910 [Methylococcaceae bacterium]
MIKQPEEVAEFLSEIYEHQFGGKKRGRYKISRLNLRALSGRRTLKESIVEEIKYYASENHGLVMNDLGDEFSVIELDVLYNYRPVPKAVLNIFIDTSGENSKASNEEDEE